MTHPNSFHVGTMDITNEMVITAAPERVFAALTTGIGLWWGAPYLENKEAHELILEPRLGGRFYECWSHPSSDKDGGLLGTVIAIKRPQLIKFEGSFGMSERCSHGIVTIQLKKSHQGTAIFVNHKAMGEITEEVRERYAAGWKDLLKRLKQLVESHEEHGLRHEPAFD